jgi:methylmalonyl-CoA/ethylmalonyl-CoA epimerase
MARIKRIDHIAVIVEDLPEALSLWRDTLGMDVEGIKDLPGEAAQVAFLPVGESEVELVKPTTSDSGLAKYLAKYGPGMHHICLEVDDIHGMLAQLKEKGVRLVDETPKSGEDGKLYAFIHPKATFGVLVELYEYP